MQTPNQRRAAAVATLRAELRNMTPAQLVEVVAALQRVAAR